MVLLAALLVLSCVQVSTSYTCSPSGFNVLCRLSATADVWIETDTNLNFHNFLLVGIHQGNPLKRTLIKFESIPSSCHAVLTARMYLRYFEAFPLGSASWIPRPIEARQVLRSWRETEATPRLRFAHMPWSENYLGLNNNDARSTADDTQTVSMFTPPGYVAWDITTSATNWHAGQPNYGMLLRVTNENVLDYDIRFFSRERSAEVPYLDVLCAGM